MAVIVYVAAKPTSRVQEPCISAHLVELCSIHMLIAGSNLSTLPHPQFTVCSEHPLQVLIGCSIHRHDRGLASCADAALACCLSVVPAGHYVVCCCRAPFTGCHNMLLATHDIEPRHQ